MKQLSLPLVAGILTFAVCLHFQTNAASEKEGNKHDLPLWETEANPEGGVLELEFVADLAEWVQKHSANAIRDKEQFTDDKVRKIANHRTDFDKAYAALTRKKTPLPQDKADALQQRICVVLFRDNLLDLIKSDANKDAFTKLLYTHTYECNQYQYMMRIDIVIPFTIKNAQELKGAEINLKQYHNLNTQLGYYPIHIATILRKPNAARAILELSSEDAHINSLIGLLFQDPVPGRLEWFLNNNIISPDWRNGYGTLLMAAGDYNRPELVRVLLEADANPDLTPDGSAQAGITPFDNTATFRNSLNKYSAAVQKAWNDFKAQQKKEVNTQLRRHEQQLPEGDTSTPQYIPKDIEGLIGEYYK